MLIGATAGAARVAGTGGRVPTRSRPKPTEQPLVSVVVVTYETPPKMLADCLGGVIASDHRPIEVVVVDNSHSSVVADFVSSYTETAASAATGLIFRPQNRNSGYARATNAGVGASSGEFVLLLNPDAVLEPTAISAMVEAASRRSQAIGFAPKVTLEGHDLILDSVGIDLFLRAEGAQRGLGEPDIGQFDVEEQVAGLCFAAALIRRAAFSAGSVGALDERFFMFYEDVDWSMRALMQGQQFWTVPAARVRHVHSASTREMRSNFKYRLIQRNIVWTAAKNLERNRVGGVVARRTLRILGAGILGRHPWEAFRLTGEIWLGMPRVLTSRKESQRRRIHSDREVLSKGRPRGSFDATKYRPIPSVDTLVSILSRLYVSSPSPALGDLVLRLTLAARTSSARPQRMVQLVRESGIEVPPGLEWLLQRLESD